MKRLMGWLFNFAAAVSFLLWLATAIAWPISYWREATVRRNNPAPGGMQTIIALNDQRLWFVQGSSQQVIPTTVIYSWESSPSPPSPISLFRIGREIHGDQHEFYVLGFLWSFDPTFLFIGVGVPFWFLLVVFVCPIIAWAGHRRQTALPLHHCKQCGYDLRATPERCPECGTVPEAAKEAAT
jgi:hypothetical protein